MYVEGNDNSDNYAYIIINVNPCDSTDSTYW